MAMLPPPPSAPAAAAVRTCPPRARQQQRAAAGSCAGMPAQSIFTLAAPPADFLRRFRDDGYCAFPGAISPGGCDALEADMKGCLQTKAWGFGAMDERVRLKDGDTGTFGMGKQSMLVRGPVAEDAAANISAWPAPGTASFQLIDDPFIARCLELAIGGPFHFCHCAYGFRTPGSKGMGFHQDHHHWNSDLPVNRLERAGYYIQALYYPSGFTRGDGSLRFIPRSHKVIPEYGRPHMFNAEPGELPGQHSNPAKGSGFEVEEPSMPPGSLVLIDARMYHAVYDKPAESPQPYRSYLNFIFKQATHGKLTPPHRFTQPIPPSYPMDTSLHRMMFDRLPWAEGLWEATPPDLLADLQAKL